MDNWSLVPIHYFPQACLRSLIKNEKDLDFKINNWHQVGYGWRSEAVCNITGIEYEMYILPKRRSAVREAELIAKGIK